MVRRALGSLGFSSSGPEVQSRLHCSPFPRYEMAKPHRALGISRGTPAPSYRLPVSSRVSTNNGSDISFPNSVGRAFRAHFREMADSADPDLYAALFEYIDIDVHAPVLDLPEYGQRSRPGVLSRTVIQGNFQVDRRDYPHIFADLLNALKSTWALVFWGLGLMLTHI